MPSYLISALLVALVSTALFALGLVFALNLGFLFLCLPTLPLFWAGFSRGSFIPLVASLISAVLISLLTNLTVGVVFLLTLGLPAYYISKLAILWREEGETRVWFPIGIIFLRLILYACGMVSAIALYYALQGNSLRELLEPYIRIAFEHAEPEYADIAIRLASSWSFMIFALATWSWALLLCVHAYFIHHLLVQKKRNIRPDFSIGLFLPPNGMLVILGICALAALLGSTDLAYLANFLLISLLFPYFLLGTAWIHEMVKSWPTRRFLLFFFYLMVFILFWPVLLIAAMGLFYHIKHLSGPSTSAKN